MWKEVTNKRAATMVDETDKNAPILVCVESGFVLTGWEKERYS